MLNVVTMLWDADEGTPPNSRCFDESWVEKLYGNFRRQLTRPFRFICFSEHWRRMNPDIEHAAILQPSRGGARWGRLLEPFRLNEPMILADLDTVIVGNIDHMADYTMGERVIVQPRNPYNAEESIAGFVLVPRGHRWVYDSWVENHSFNGSNMEWLRQFKCNFFDTLWGDDEVVSLKATDIRRKGLSPKTKVVFFHGSPKQNKLTQLDWVRDNWRPL